VGVELRMVSTELAGQAAAPVLLLLAVRVVHQLPVMHPLVVVVVPVLALLELLALPELQAVQDPAVQVELSGAVPQLVVTAGLVVFLEQAILVWLEAPRVVAVAVV